MRYNIIKPSGNEIEHPYFRDLIHNFNYFHNHQMTEEKLLSYSNKWKDNSNLNHLPTVEDLLNTVPYEELMSGQQFVCKIPVSMVWTSAKSYGGYDRIEKVSIEKCIEKLNQKTFGDSELKGFSDADAGVLQAKVRITPNGEGGYDVTIVKFIGNHRIVKKLLANGGEDGYVRMMISFHNTNIYSLDNYIAVESEGHTTDAGDRVSQNEEQRFFSGLRAKRTEWVQVYNWMRSMEVNYRDIMNIDSVEGAEDFITLKSLQGLNRGTENGMFREYGKDNVNNAMRIIKRIAKEITGESTILITPLHCMTQMYWAFTDLPGKTNNGAPLFTVEELDRFMMQFFTMKNTVVNPFESEDMDRKNPRFSINELKQSGSMKSYAYINAHTFWPYINDCFKQNKQSKTGIGSDGAAMKMFLSKCDQWTYNEVKRIIT